MKIKPNTKYNTIAYYVVIVFAICILLVLLSFRIELFTSAARKILKAISPVIWGCVIAYLLSPIVKKIESIFSKRTNLKKKHANLVRGLSILIASIITLSAIIALFAMAIPEITDSLSSLFNNMPEYLNKTYDSISDFFSRQPEINPSITDWFEDQFANIQKTILDWVTNLKPTVDIYLIKLKDGILSFLIGVKDFVLGFIVSIYLLFSKEHFFVQFKKTMYAILPKKTYDLFMVKGTHANKIFSDFMVGKAIDSLIIGMLCFVVLIIFGIPNAMLISFIVGITNMIPFFGPFIGAIPSAVLVLLTAPKKTILFVIIILILQQFDGNILGPKILGNKLNLPTFWILFSIFFFGNLFGFAGMLLGVPIFAVIYTLIKEFIEDRIRIKNIASLSKNNDGEQDNEDDDVPDDIFTEDDKN
ncbi:MAG: AI-2E family transporter [Oscillospiraceae bacterium]|nr:AI-2E family transporter [Oscillospiraceae bacterium]